MYTSTVLSGRCSLQTNQYSMEQSLHSGDAGFVLLKPEEAAHRLRVSRTTLYRMVDRRDIAVYRVGSALRFSPRDIEASARRFGARDSMTYGRAKDSQEVVG